MHPKCLEAMDKASREFVDLNKLLVEAGKKAAELARAPPGYTAHIVTGAAASIVLAVCASMTGDDKEKIAALPDTTGLNNKILLDGASDTRWNRNILLTGAQPVLLGSTDAPMTAAQLESALKEGGVAAFLYFAVGDDEGEHSLALAEVINIAHAHGVNVIVDGAAQLPPVSNVSKKLRFAIRQTLTPCTPLLLPRTSFGSTPVLESTSRSSVAASICEGHRQVVSCSVARTRFMRLVLMARQTRRQWAGED